MISRLREADCPQTAFVEARGDLCPWRVFLCDGFFCAKTSPPIPPNRKYTSQWKAVGGLFRVLGPRIDVSAPPTEAGKQFNTHRLRYGSVQRILSAMLRREVLWLR